MSSKEKVAKKTFSSVDLRVFKFKKGWLCMWESSSCKTHSLKKFLGSLAKLDNSYNRPIGPKSSLDLDVILTRNLLIRSQTRYHCATKSGNSQLHNKDLWAFVKILAARCHFVPIRTLSGNKKFHWKPSKG